MLIIINWLMKILYYKLITIIINISNIVQVIINIIVKITASQTSLLSNGEFFLL